MNEKEKQWVTLQACVAAQVTSYATVKDLSKCQCGNPDIPSGADFEGSRLSIPMVMSPAYSEISSRTESTNDVEIFSDPTMREVALAMVTYRYFFGMSLC